MMKKGSLFTFFTTILFLSACSSIKYQPVETISRIDLARGYRLYNAVLENKKSENLIIMMFSGGGNRAASLGYGVLEEFAKTPINPTAKGNTLLENVDLVYGVSGGSVLAAYFSLEGKNVVPTFEKNFLKTNFQKQMMSKLFSTSSMSRLTSPQFGRGDLLEEQLNLALFKNKTFADLQYHRQGPFAVISATDMKAGQRINFTQEYFDLLCLNLEKVKIARAVAASSSVPLIFSPLTFNNNGGQCFYNTASQMMSVKGNLKGMERLKSQVDLYKHSDERPFIHLVDGGLTDNLGLRSLLDVYDMFGSKGVNGHLKQANLKNVIVINVNAQNQMVNEIDKSADIPSTSDIVNSIINVPIDNNTQNTLNSFKNLIEEWNTKQHEIKAYFISLNLKDLPPSQLRTEMLNIDTSLYLPKEDVNKLKQSARILLAQSKEYQKVLKILQ
ncbi:Patatin-like phospholipase [Phocoenobacter uteri]|uniref:Patatin-like phospholipase n=1 Tax=Phocoenobacter uteri TaxID=146806 RepID=A0A379CDC8_9PAST|nr:patatin-like phospholipase family protein [Phocoenobacter uteri]MDG6881721.1 patatin [Phocoenobacter uteri]SUB59756.1 Patatin-like phospholipase [Phocoenobacter uteri]